MSDNPTWQKVSDASGHPPADSQSLAVLAEINDALRGLRFGQVTIVVQDGVVVQIDRLEKYRIHKADRS